MYSTRPSLRSPSLLFQRELCYVKYNIAVGLQYLWCLMKKTLIVDVVLVNSVYCGLRDGRRGERGQESRVGQLLYKTMRGLI
jgi:hypothetical protein